MTINFSELKDLSSYTFKKDKDLKLIVKNITKKDMDLNKVYFILCKSNGEVVYKSKKGCFEVVDYKKEVISGKWLCFNKYTYVDAKKLRFKADKRGYSSYAEHFRQFCNNRKSGREIYSYVYQFIRDYNQNYMQNYIAAPTVNYVEPKHSNDLIVL